MALGTPPQTFEFSVDNGVLAFTMVDDAQPIICDGFSSTGDAKVSGNPSNSVETDEGNDAGAAAGAVIAVIVARRVRSVFLVEPQSPTHGPGRPLWTFMARASACATQRLSSCAFPHLAYPRHLRWRLLVYEEGRGARQGCPHAAAAAGHRAGMAAQPANNGKINPLRCPLHPRAWPIGVPEANGAPTHHRAQPRPWPALSPRPSAPS